jgi:hypothetical protein
VRWFFYLLILTNLVLAGWLYWQTEAPQQREPMKQDLVQGRLQLLSELPQQSLQPIPHVSTTPEALSPATADTTSDRETPSSETAMVTEMIPAEGQVATCIRISPLAKAANVDTVTRKLVQANLTVLDSGEGFTERQTYWVMIAPYKSDKAAREAAAELARVKVRDFLLVRSGEFENGISLGLFSQKEGAESRLREINALKLNIRKPEIRLRTSSVRSHWLTTRVRGEDALKTLQNQLVAEGMQSTTVECPP